MRFPGRFPKALISGVSVAVLLFSFGGCGSEKSPIGYLIDAVGGDPYALTEEGSRELARFNSVYREYASQSPDGQFGHFSDAFKRVRVNYIHEIPDAKLIDAAIKGVRELEAEPQTVPPGELVEAALDSMMASLDPHSAYLNPEELHETEVSNRGEFGGLGIEVTMEDGVIKIISPLEDTPAWRAGLKSGDRITHLDGKPLAGKTLLQAVKLMRGRPGTDIRLTVNRDGYPPFGVTITRAVIKVQSVRWRILDDIGYIRVARFTERVEDGVEEAMAGIHEKLGPRLKAVVLDLRNNPGGLLDQSVILADAFLDQGTIVTVKGRRPGSERVFEAKSGDLARGLPMVVLINGGSASASEIVAGALQDHHRAFLMGVRSFGKGSVQTITPLPREGALKLTTQLYFSPSGRAIQALGVEPDIRIAPAEPGKLQREADLPGAFPGTAAGTTMTRASLSESDCPAAGEKEDRPLGCALAFLRAGSAENFLAQIRSRAGI